MTGTFSKHPRAFGFEDDLAVMSGNGAKVTLNDGNTYLDWVCGLGTNLLGYNDMRVITAVERQLRNGVGFSLPNQLEYAVAEKLVNFLVSGGIVGWDKNNISVRFAKTGTDGTAMAVRLARAITGKEPILSCYDEQTEVLTRNGFVSIVSISSQDEIATLNRTSMNIEYHKPYCVYKYVYQGNMIHFQSQSGDLLVTPNHIVFDIPQSKNRRLVGSEAITHLGRSTPVDMYCGSEWIGKPARIICIPEIEKDQPRLVRDGKKIIEFPAEIFMEFLGWYLSEGSAFERSSTHQGYIIQIRQNHGRKLDRIIEIVKEMGFDPRVRSDGGVVFSSKELWYWLRPLGTTKTKHIPEEIKCLDRNLLVIMLNAMIDGDGTRRSDGKAFKYFTTSPVLADDVQEICIKVGLRATSTLHHNTSGFLNAAGKPSCIYHISITENQTVPLWANEELYDGYVYCVNVPNHILMVRRNGKCVWSGNSGYHGWASEFSDTSPALGIPVGYQRDLIRKIKWNDKSSVMSAAWREDFAAIIVEHPADETDPDWYDFLRRICDESKALLILDEVVTGLRFGLGGAASLYNAMPDLIVMGKALGNGVPISALVGRKEYMDWFSRSDPVFCSSTHWGEALGLAAASAVLDIWNQSAVEYIWSIGKMLMDGLAKSGYVVVGHPPRSLLKFDNKYDQAFFIHEMRERDILMNRPNFISTSHSQHSVKETVAAANEVAQLREKTDPSYYKLPFVLFTGR